MGMPRRLAILLLLLLSPALALAQRVSLLVPLDQLEAIARRDSTDPLALYDLGLGYWVSGDYDSAEVTLRRAAGIDPRVAEVQLALAYLPYGKRPKLWREESKGKVPPEYVEVVRESNDRFRRTFMLDPMVDMRVVGLVIPPRDAIIIGGNADRYYAALVLGLEYFWGGDYASAYASLEKAFAISGDTARDKVPGFLLWYHGLAAAHLALYPVALQDFQLLLDRALEREKSDSVTRFSVLPSIDIRYVQATVLRRSGNLPDAKAQLEEVLTADLSYEMAHAQLAEIAEKEHRWSDAIVERQRAIETSPGDVGLRLDYALTLAKAGRHADALVEFSQVQEQLPLNARVPYYMGQSAIALGRTEEAMQYFRRFAALAPSRFTPQVRQLEQRYGNLRTPS